MTRPRHLSIFLPRETPFYRALLAQMRQGFARAGVETSGHLGLLGAEAMAAWCAAHAPDVVFEMNRARGEAPFLPRAVRHVCWVVDFGGRALGDFHGSDITYLFGPSWPARYPHAGFFRWFGPGAAPDDYATLQPGELIPAAYRADVAFAGHIPRPWSPQELARDVGGLTFGALLPEFEAEVRAARATLRSADDFIAIAKAVAAARGHTLTLDATLRYDLSGRVIRHLNRCDLIDAARAAGGTLALYGPDNWRQWPAYAPHYRGPLDTPAELRAAYLGADVTLHEGNGVHFRALDCMCAGGVLFFRATTHDHGPGGIATLFTPHEHYVPFTLEDLPAQIAALKSDPTRRARLGAAAAAAIRAHHTWADRAREVLRDLASL